YAVPVIRRPVIKYRRIGHYPGSASDIECACDAGAKGPHLAGYMRIIWIDEAYMIEIERHLSGKDPIPVIGLVPRVETAPIRKNTANIGALGMGNDPTFVIKHEGVIAARIIRRNREPLFGRQDVLGELHQVPVVQRKNYYSFEPALVICA